MPSTSKKEKARKIKEQGVVVEHVDSYANEPYFVKKATGAKQAIEKYGLPQRKQE